MELVYAACIASLMISTACIVLCFYSLSEVSAFKKSTHKIQIINPATQEFTTLSDEQKKELLRDPFDNI